MACSEKEITDIWKDAFDVVDYVLDIYLQKAYDAGGKECGAYKLAHNILEQLRIEFDYRIRP
jgi:hypothetical protein